MSVRAWLHRPWAVVVLTGLVIALSVLPWYSLSGSVVLSQHVTAWSGSTVWTWSVVLALAAAVLGLAAGSVQSLLGQRVTALVAALAGLAAVAAWWAEWWRLRHRPLEIGWVGYAPLSETPSIRAAMTGWCWSALAVYLVLTVLLVARALTSPATPTVPAPADGPGAA